MRDARPRRGPVSRGRRPGARPLAARAARPAAALAALAAALAALLGAGRLGAAAPPAADFHVAPDGSDAWSGRAATPNADRTDGPFATPARARDAVRALVAAGLKADVRVLLRGGTYYLRDGLVLGPADSGTARHSITYAAYPGEVPALVGGVVITGWARRAPEPAAGAAPGAALPPPGPVWQAAMPDGPEPRELFEDGVRLEAARTPDTGYFHVEAPVAGQESTCFRYRAGDLDPAGWDLKEARLFCWPTHDWHTAEPAVRAIDPAARTVTLASPVGALKAGNRYVVRGVLALLDRPGEAHVSAAGRRLYAWPRHEPITDRTMVASTARHVVAVEGAGPDRTVRNVHLEGLDLAVATADVVRFTDAEDCSLRFSSVENGRGSGVLVSGRAQRITVYGNRIRENGHHGVSLRGPGPTAGERNRDHVVENNHIHDCGRLVGHGYGVEINQSGHNRVLHNDIHHMPRYGVSLKGPRFQVLRQQVPGVTWENHYDFLHARSNLVAFNHIHRVNLDSQDTGAIEAWGPGRDNVLDHNLIHDTGNTEFDLQSGIYLDDAADHFTVSNNIIYNIIGTHGNQPVYAKGIGNRLVNNILVVGPTNTSAIRSFFMAEERCDRHEYLRNLIVFEGGAERPRGRFGTGVGNLHAPGTALAWPVDVPADGEYALWLRYAALNRPYGTADLAGRTTMQAGDGPPVTLQNLPDTGGWGEFRWSRAAEVRLAQGPQRLRWVNVKGGGLNWDAFALADDPAWVPEGVQPAPPAPGRHVIIVQTEVHDASDLGRNRRPVYEFQNWSDERVAASDDNLFWNPGGEVTVKGGPASGDFAKWRSILDGRFDRRSVVADPMFVDLAGRDFRLRPGSPALGLGFQPIDTSRIGLKADFPARLRSAARGPAGAGGAAPGAKSR